MVRQLLCALCVSSAASNIACTIAGPRTGLPATSELAPQLSRSRDIVEHDEIRKATVSNAYEAIAQLRPEFLRIRAEARVDNNGAAATHAAVTSSGDLSGMQPTVYVNGLRLGGPSMLSSISAALIIRIRYYKEPMIPIAYGRNNPGGIIEVTTKS